MSKETCVWTENTYRGGWDTECGKWFFIEDLSFDNDPAKDVGHCMECGKEIEVQDD